jgi:uncharacterized protein with PIN domain/sulfur carrier protein ThiS
MKKPVFTGKNKEMVRVFIRFYEELNFFLPSDRKKCLLERTCKKGTTVKALIEEMGIPHTEVDLVLVNGHSKGFEYQLADNDRVSVYPVFESFDIGDVSKVRPTPLREIRFILDVHLGKLAKRLRLLGFDTIYSNHFEDEQISVLAVKEKRIILTRDRGLLKRKTITHGYCIRSKDPHEQLREVIGRFDLLKCIKPFSRCLQCNSSLVPAYKEEIMDRLPQKVKEKYSHFSRCPKCNKIYWLGSHWENMKKILDNLLSTQL